MRLRASTGAGALSAGTTLSVNGAVPATLIGVDTNLPRWLNPAGNVVLFYNIDLGNLQQIDLDTNVVSTVAADIAVSLAAGNSLYVASGGVTPGVRSNIGGWTTLTLAGVGDMDETGDFALVQAESIDNGLSIYSSAGALVSTLAVPLATGGVIRCRTGLCAFLTRSGAWELRNLSDGTLVDFANRVEPVLETIPIELADGRIFVVERTTTTLTLREAEGNQGYVISGATVHNPDVIELTANVVRIGWSASSAELNTDLRMADVRVGTGTQTLWTTATGSLVSSTGPTLPVVSLPSTLAGSGLAALFAGHAPFTDPDSGMLTLPFGKPWVDLVSRTLGQPVNLATQTTGVLPAGSVEPDLSVLNGANITAGTTPLSALESQPASTLVGRGDSGPGSPEVITIGAGLLMTGETLSATGAGSDPSFGVIQVSGETDVVATVPTDTVEYVAGSGMVITTDAGATPPQVIFEATGGSGGCYIPLVDGSEPPVFITDGSGHLITVAYAP